MQRYFINESQINKNIVSIEGDDVHHIKNVMRMRVNDQVIVSSDDNSFLCEIVSISDIVELGILENIHENNELKVNVTIAQGLVRREKTEEVIRRITELGATKYIPVNMKRSIIKVKESKTERWLKIVKEASEQSHRNKLMVIEEIKTLKELVLIKKNYDLCLFAHVSDQIVLLSDYTKEFTGKNILILVGPEGGYDPTEVKLLLDHGFKMVSLGRLILRTETAPLYIMSILNNKFGD